MHFLKHKHHWGRGMEDWNCCSVLTREERKKSLLWEVLTRSFSFSGCSHFFQDYRNNWGLDLLLSFPSCGLESKFITKWAEQLKRVLQPIRHGGADPPGFLCCQGNLPVCQLHSDLIFGLGFSCACRRSFLLPSLLEICRWSSFLCCFLLPFALVTLTESGKELYTAGHSNVLPERPAPIFSSAPLASFPE